MRNSMRLLTALGAVILLFPGQNAEAQRRRGLVELPDQHERHGAWLSFALGAGFENYQYSGVPGGWRRRDALGNRDDLMKPSFSIAAGGTVNPHLRLGGEINAWVNEYTDAEGFGITETLVGGMLTGQVFPARNLGLYIKGGLGISRSGSEIDGYGSGTGETGFSYQYGLGYEIKLARNFFLTPQFNVLEHRSNQGGNPPDPQGTLRERVWSIGVGLTFQPGR